MTEHTLIESIRHKLQEVFEEQIPFNKMLNLKLTEITVGYAKILIPFSESLVGEYRQKRIHGGVIMAAMDAVGGAASMTTINMKDDKIATIDLRCDFLSPAQPQDLILTAEVRKSGNRVVFTSMQAFHANEPEKILAEGRATYSVKRIEGSKEN